MPDVCRLDKRNKRICIIGCSIYALTIIAALVFKVLIQHKYQIPCSIMIIGAILYSIIVARIDGDVDTVKNRAILTYSSLTKLVFLFGSTFENKLFIETAINRQDDPLLYVAYIFTLISVIIETSIYIKNKKTKVLKIYVLIVFLALYFVGVLSIYSFWILLMLIPILNAYTQFEDVKLVIIATVIADIIAILGAFSHIYFIETGTILADSSIISFPIEAIRNALGKSHSQEVEYLALVYVVITGLLLVYSVAMIRVTVIIKKLNQEKIDIIEQEQEKVENLTEKVIDIGKEIKKSAYNTDEIVDDLDKSIESSVKVLEEITEDNKKNVQRIEKQEEISLKLSDLINNLVLDVDNVETSTKESLNELDRSKRTFENLKAKSNKIYNKNNEMIGAINEFVESTRQVKNITKGIENISDETNLLSLNASIKSVRAGEVGKGFAVVADEVRVLADETANFTNNINTIVEKLEDSALVTQRIIGKISKAIDEENITIDKTISDFKDMENSIFGLSNNVFEISDRAGDVTRFKDEIESHINVLKSSSESVGINTEQAENMNIKNKEKIDKTRNLMEELLNTSLKLEEQNV